MLLFNIYKSLKFEHDIELRGLQYPIEL